MTNKDTDLCPEPIVKLVTKHLRTTYRLPISPLMQAVIRPVLERLQHEQAEGRSLLLDAGCGTGESTLTIAQRFSDRFVLGVDRSLARLRKTPPLPANALVVRARLEEFWLMAHNAGIVFEKRFCFIPTRTPNDGKSDGAGMGILSFQPYWQRHKPSNCVLTNDGMQMISAGHYN